MKIQNTDPLCDLILSIEPEGFKEGDTQKFTKITPNEIKELEVPEGGCIKIIKIWRA